MIETLTPRIRGAILDLDGTIWRGSQPIGDLPVLFRRLDEIGIRLILATNNATKRIEQYLERIQGYGIDLEPWQVINSAQAAAHLLKKAFPEGGPVFMVGEIGLKSALEEEGFFLSEDKPVAVVAGLDRQVNYDKLSRGATLIRSGLPFIGTNPDATFPAPDGLIPGSGTILAALSTASGVKPLIAGKPERAMFDLAMLRLATTPIETLVIGDRLDTDIAGGQRAGCRTALVLSGVSTRLEADAWTPPVDLVASNWMQLLDCSNR
jgi:4-nitrophenyl phosphatase